MYKLTALTPLCFQISDNKSVIHCFTKIISSKFIPGDFLINVIFLYDFVIKTLNRNHKYCLCIVVGLSNPEFLFKREVHTSKSYSLDETRLKRYGNMPLNSTLLFNTGVLPNPKDFS